MFLCVVSSSSSVKCSSVPERSHKSLCWDCIRYFPIQRWAVGWWNITWGFAVRPAGLHSISPWCLSALCKFVMFHALWQFCETTTTDTAIYYKNSISGRGLTKLSLRLKLHYPAFLPNPNPAMYFSTKSLLLQWCSAIKAQKSFVFLNISSTHTFCCILNEQTGPWFSP